MTGQWLTVLTVALTGMAGLGGCMISMPGTSHRGPLPDLTERERRLGHELAADVRMLAETIGERNVWRAAALDRAAAFIEERLTQAGHAVRRHSYPLAGRHWDNLEVEVPGRARPQQIVLVGAHYDSVRGSPGANDNATGVATVLALARAFAARPALRTLRLVAFVNEEPPLFQTAGMGSLVYATRSRERGERIVAMVALDGLGYYADAPGTQRYPFPFSLFYPSTADFVAFVGNTSSRALVRRSIGAFRRSAAFPSEGGALPGVLPGVGWSDHWAFWQQGYPAIMVTDTLPFRYGPYHGADDTAEKVDYPRLARVVAGLEKVVETLVTTAD